MNREEITNRLLILRGLSDLVSAEITRTRTAASELFTRPGQCEVGELDGRGLGNVRLDKGVSTWGISDRAAFLSWVKAYRPDEIETTESVRSSYERAVLAQLKAEAALVDKETGELIVPDGVAPKKGAPSLKVTASEEAPQIVMDALGDVAVVLGLAERAELLP